MESVPPLVFEEFENFYIDNYEEVAQEVQEEELVINPNEVGNCSEEYIMDDLDHEEFDKNLKDMSLSELVSFPEDLKDFGIDIISEKSDIEPSLCIGSKESHVAPESEKNGEVIVDENVSPVDLGGNYLLNEVEVVDEKTIPQRASNTHNRNNIPVDAMNSNNNSKNANSNNSKVDCDTDISDSSIVDVGSINDNLISSPSSNEKPVRQLLVAHHKRFIPSKAYGMICATKKVVQRKDQPNDNNCKNTKEAKRELIKLGEEIKKDGIKPSSCLKSKKLLDRKLQDTVQMLLERRRRNDVAWQCAMKAKAANALEVFQTSKGTHSQNNITANVSPDKCKGVADAESPDHNYARVELDTAQKANYENCFSKNAPISKNMDTYSEGSALRESITDKSINQQKVKKLKVVCNGGSPKKMTSILNLSKFNSIVKSSEPLKRSHSEVNCLNGDFKASLLISLKTEDTATNIANKVPRAASSTSLVNAMKNMASMNSFQNEITHEKAWKTILSGDASKGKSSPKWVCGGSSEESSSLDTGGNFKAPCTTNRATPKQAYNSNSTASHLSFNPNKTALNYIISKRSNNSKNLIAIRKPKVLVPSQTMNPHSSVNPFVVIQSSMDDYVGENVVISTTSYHLNPSARSFECSEMSDLNDMNSIQVGLKDASEMHKKKTKKKISLSDYRKMSRSQSFSVLKPLGLNQNVACHFDHTVTADHNYFSTGLKKDIKCEGSEAMMPMKCKMETEMKTEMKTEWEDVLQNNKIPRNFTDTDILKHCSSIEFEGNNNTNNNNKMNNNNLMVNYNNYDAMSGSDSPKNDLTHHTHVPLSFGRFRRDSSSSSSSYSSSSSSQSSSSCSSCSRSSSSSSSRSSRSSVRSFSRSPPRSSLRSPSISNSRSRSVSRSLSRACSRSYSRSRSRSCSRSRSRSCSRSRSRSCSRTCSISASCIDGDYYSDHSSSVPRSDHSRKSSRRRKRSKRQKIYSRDIQKETERKMSVAGKDRRIIYIGCLKANTTQHDLEMRLRCFGKIVNGSIHSKPSGDYYGFVTYEKSAHAARCKKDGNKVPGCEQFDFGYGGRRHFCGSGYNDLDKDITIYRHQQRHESTRPIPLDDLLEYHAKIKIKRQEDDHILASATSQEHTSNPP